MHPCLFSVTSSRFIGRWETVIDTAHSCDLLGGFRPDLSSAQSLCLRLRLTHRIPKEFLHTSCISQTHTLPSHSSAATYSNTHRASSGPLWMKTMAWVLALAYFPNDNNNINKKTTHLEHCKTTSKSVTSHEELNFFKKKEFFFTLSVVLQNLA